MIMDMFYKNYLRPSKMPDNEVLKNRIQSMLKYCMACKVLPGKVRLYFKKPYNEEIKKGLWILEFNKSHRTFENLFSIYLFLKDIVKNIDKK